MKLDVDWVREQFALPGDVVFFDNAGGSFTLHRVIDRVSTYMRETPVQLGATHRLSALAAERLRAATRSLASLVNAEPGEIVTGPSTSALIDRVARALRPRLVAGDEIVVTEFDHESNISPWLRLEEHGIRLRWWRLNRDSRRAEIDDLGALLTDRTRLIACTHCSNVLGEVMPVSEIVRVSHAAGAQVLVDGVAWAPHRPVDVKALGVDYYVMSLYKVFGPHIGLLYGRRDRLEALANINLAHLAADAIPYKLQPGGTPYELVYGAAGIADYLDALASHLGTDRRGAWSAIASHEAQLGQRLMDRLSTIQGIRWHGPMTAAPQVRLPIYSFTVSGHPSHSVVTALDDESMGARHGNFHSARLIDALGLDRDDGVIRFSLAHYNSAAEIDHLADTLLRLL